MRAREFLLGLVMLVSMIVMPACNNSPTEPEIKKDWVTGEIYAQLNDDIRGEALDDFLLSFSEYELKIIFHDRIYNRFHFSFNPVKIDQYLFREELARHDNVIFTLFKMLLPDWCRGFIEIHFYEHTLEEEIGEFMLSYKDYEFRNDIWNFSFNYLLINEFDFLEMIQLEVIVKEAGFIYMYTPD